MNKNSKFIKLLLVIITVLLVISGCTSSNEGITDKSTKVNEESLEQTEDNTDIDDTLKKKDESEIVVNGELEVHFIDVGQGDSVLIRQGDNNMLIDAGERHKGKDVLAYLAKQGVTTLDYVIGTHPHSDHIGGLSDVIDTLEVKGVIMPDKSHTTQTFEKLLDSISNNGLKITTPKINDKYTLGEAEFTIIAPNGSSYSNLNDYSVSIKLEYGNNSFVFTGDAEKASENEMVNNGIDLSADVLKAGHHGSNTSNTDSFLNAVNPDYVVIQVGEGNKYNHPDSDILSKFNQRGIQVYRNDLHGSIIVMSDGDNIVFKTDSGDIVSKPVKETPEKTSEPEEPVKDNIKKDNNEGGEVESTVSTFIGTKTTKKFHNEDCRYVPKEENREYFGSYQEAIDAGYEGCKVCNPN